MITYSLNKEGSGSLLVDGRPATRDELRQFAELSAANERWARGLYGRPRWINAGYLLGSLMISIAFAAFVFSALVEAVNNSPWPAFIVGCSLLSAGWLWERFRR